MSDLNWYSEIEEGEVIGSEKNEDRKAKKGKQKKKEQTNKLNKNTKKTTLNVFYYLKNI